MFEETFQQYRDIIVKDAILIVEGMLRFDDFIEAWRLQAKTLMDIDRARERFARRLWLRWPAEFDGPQGMKRFEDLLEALSEGAVRRERGRQPARITPGGSIWRTAGRCGLHASFSINCPRWSGAKAGIWCMVRAMIFAARKLLHGAEFFGI